MADGKMSPVAAALAGRMPLPIRPFDASQDAPADLGLGGLSTEVLETFQTPQGDYVNVPSAWFMGDMGPFLVDDPLYFANDYERGTGSSFPRFDALDQAIRSAEIRSASGGGMSGSILDPRYSQYAREPIFGMGLVE